MTTKKNIVFFLADDQRFDTLAALGNKEIITPNLDELVRRGTTFTQAHIPGGTVGAICMPSRAMLHTSKTLFQLDNDGSEIPQDHVLLGEHLRNAGYRTFGTGKWHNGPSAYARSFTDGDEIFFGGMFDHWNVPVSKFDPTGQYEQAKPWILDPFQSNTVTHVRADHVHLGKHSSELFCDAAADWLEQYNDDAPFMMYVSFMAPHDPRSMPERFKNMYDPDRITLPENYADEHLFHYGVEDIRDETLAPYPRTPEIVRQHIAEYYAMITHLDEELGKVLDTLKRTGKYEDTIIVFAADNGLAVGQHGLFGKQNHYEHSIRVPLIMAGPGIAQGEMKDDYVYLMDIFPTLCDLNEIEIPSSVEGQSLAPLLRNESIQGRESLYFVYADLIRSVKDKRYKLIEYRSENVNETQLFDLVEDPNELNNLYGEQGYEQIVEKLRKELIRYRDEWDDYSHPSSKLFWDRYEQKSI